MTQKIAVETLTLKEVSQLFQESLSLAMPKAKVDIAKELDRIKKENINKFKWVQPYEDFKGAILNFYCQKFPHNESPVVSVGMTHRTTKGLILVTLDTSNGGIPANGIANNLGWQKWVKIHTAHYCQRYAERILGIKDSTFKQGSEGIMFADDYGPVRITDSFTDGIDEIEFQFKEGQAFGYRDSINKIVYFRTVYSNDMLKGDRLKFREEWALTLEELTEIFSWKKNH